MPLAFPSHQGLILPLCRIFPARIDAVALCLGAALPDIFDTLAWPIRGELGQWFGHSLLGVVLTMPLGVSLTWVARRVAGKKLLSRLEAWRPEPPTLLQAHLAVGIGSLSHVVFDLPTHGHTRILWPWYEDLRLLPAWWNHAWSEIPLPFYREPYPLAPHTIAWLALTALGITVFFDFLRKPGGKTAPRTRL